MAYKKFKLPPMLKKPEIDADFELLPEAETLSILVETFRDSEQRERKRWGLLEDFLRDQHTWLINIAVASACDCFRWIHQVVATIDDTGLGAQANFVLPAWKQLENNEYQLVFARGSFQYHNVGYTINVATNTITFIPGVLLGECVTIYAVKHDDVQEVFYEQDVVGAPMPYIFAPPVTVDRAPGRQLVFARNSARFYHSGRNPDEYTVSATLNQLSLTAGLGLNNWSMFCRLRECGVIFHEEVLATVPGQTVFQPANPGNVVREHGTLRMIVTQRTTYLHPGFDFTTNVMTNTVTINAPGLAVGQPLNMWFYRG